MKTSFICTTETAPCWDAESLPRHGNEDKLVTIMGVMQALVSFVQDSKDSLRSVVAGEHKFVFLVRDHLLLVGVTRGMDSTQQMLLQLMYVYNQDLVFALIIAKNQLVTLVRMKKYYLHPMDLHLIINLVNASESFKEAESWTPICLPKFDASV
nr:hypothetical protein BaRGS_001988 [Batillaria attramentaria]